MRYLGLLLCLLAAGTLAACDDDPVEEKDTHDVVDLVEVADTHEVAEEIIDLVDIGPDVDETGLVFEGGTPETELADCFSTCGHDATPPIFRYKDFKGMRGVIDGNCHTYANGAGPDIDIVAISAPVGTLWEITVEPATGSRMIPVITTHDMGKAMTYSNGLDGNIGHARTTLRAPFKNEVPVYIIIEDATNYERFNPQTHYANCDNFVGGPDYGYILRVRELAEPPQDLGLVAGSNPIVRTGTLSQRGDTNYVVFQAQATAKPQVNLRRTGAGNDFDIAAVGMKTLGGDWLWHKIVSDTLGAGTINLQGSDFRACDSGCDGLIETFSFAVLDWNGRGGEAFTYEYTLTLP